MLQVKILALVSSSHSAGLGMFKLNIWHAPWSSAIGLISILKQPPLAQSRLTCDN